MMIADLVDQVDLYEQFADLGIAVTDQEDAQLSCQQAAQWFATQSVENQHQLTALVSDWLLQRDLLLPQVREALESQLEILLQH